MPKNMSGADRAFRFVLGIILLSLVWLGPQTAWGYIGLVPLLTAIAGFCPIYALLGISTKRRTPMAG